MSISYTWNKGCITAMIGGHPYVVRNDNPKYSQACQALKAGDGQLFIKLVNIEENLKSDLVAAQTGEQKVTIRNGVVFYGDQQIDNSLTRRIIELVRADLPIVGFVKFLENVCLNPSNRSVRELYEFLEHRNLPITPDGCFLAYKSVRSDYYSKASGNLKLLKGKTDTSGHIYNGIGEEIECPRNQVDDTASNECSHGLHVGALEYAGPGGFYNNSGDNIIIVKVNPKDAVSVPTDHCAQKLRVCAYVVEADYAGPLNKPLYEQTDEKKFDEEFEDDEWEDEEQYEEIYDFDELEYGMNLEFDYRGEKRYCSVEEVGPDFITGLLLTPEENAGEYRNFKWERMTNVECEI